MPFKTVFLVAILLFAGASVAHSDALSRSLEIARSSPQVQNLLGSDITVQEEPEADLPIGDDLEFAQWSVKLSGSVGTGRLYGVANQINGSWDFSRLVLASDNGKSVDLTPPPERLHLPAVPLQTVYIVPIGLSKRESLDWAPAYYKAKLGIRVVILPRIPLDPKLVDLNRKQLDADAGFDFLLKSRPELAHDPSAIIIGITSHDMYMPVYLQAYGWQYADNMRGGDRFALLSSAHLRPSSAADQRNPEWLTSRLQKLLTKNLLILYFNLPLSGDSTSVLSGGLLSGHEIDEMTGQVIGQGGHWHPFFNPGGPGVTIYDMQDKPVLWRMVCPCGAVPDARTQVFTADLGVGLFTQRKDDFFFDDPEHFEFTRVYLSGYGVSRSFGIGSTNSLDMFLGGQMGSFIDLFLEDGGRFHFDRDNTAKGQVYRETEGGDGDFAHAVAEYSGGIWKVQRTDGWAYYFAYHPQWLQNYVTVLGYFTDPQGHKYQTERDNFGALLTFTTPSGKWLHFENDSEHRIRKITSSLGRSAQYEYDKGGRLTSVTDSEGHNDSFSYDDKGEMLTVSHGNNSPILTNEYFVNGYIKKQTMSGGRKFEFWYRSGPRNVLEQNQITDPNGLLTFVQYGPNGYAQSLPSTPPR